MDTTREHASELQDCLAGQGEVRLWSRPLGASSFSTRHCTIGDIFRRESRKHYRKPFAAAWMFQTSPIGRRDASVQGSPRSCAWIFMEGGIQGRMLVFMRRDEPT